MELDRFTFFISYFEAIRYIKKKADRCDAYEALLNYAFYGIEPDLNALPSSSAVAFVSQKHHLDASRRKAESGSKGGRSKQTASKPEANSKQTGSNKNKNIEIEEEKEIYKEIVSYLNEKTGKQFKHISQKTQTAIHARLAEGFKLDDFRAVIDKKCADWLGDKKMEEYLRPETLFGTKFEGYLNAGGNHGKTTASDFGIVL